MKVKSKLILLNLAVFTLFSSTFFVFYFSAVRLMDLKDLQKEIKELRSTILRYEYANNALLVSKDIPVNGIGWLYDELGRDLDSLSEQKTLKYLDDLTAKKIQDNYTFIKGRSFDRYFSNIHSEIIRFKPMIPDTSIEMVYQNWKNGITIDRELYDRIMTTRLRITEYINWYHPFSEQFRIITDEVYNTIAIQIRRILFRTGLTLFLSLFVSIVFILLVYKNMIQKIRNVRTGIELISGGNLSTRIRIESNDELATMGENFNTLTETIWQRLNTVGKIIHDIGQSLTENPDPGHLERTILQLAIENTQAENGAFYKHIKERQVLVPVHRTDRFALPYDEGQYREEVPIGKTILGMSAVSGEPYFVKEPGGHNLIPQRTSFDRHFISSCIILPLISEREVVGIICLEKNSDRNRFRDMDFSNIQSFIEFSAVTLKNLEKYSELLQSTGLNREMQIASDIQKSLLPPKIPKVPNFDIAANTYSVKGMSGNIYDFFQVDKSRWLFCMAEVKEMGIASSMMLVILRTLVRILVRVDQEPAELLEDLLRNFRETTGLDTEISINLCLMEPGDKRYSYCGTKEQNMLVFSDKNDTMNLVKAEISDHNEYKTIKGQLGDKDYLVLMTDGFYKSVNKSGEAYGWDPVRQILRKYKQRNSRWLQEAIVKDISFFEKEMEQHQDRTMFIAGFRE